MMKEENFIIRVVEMHYKQGLSQQQISEKLNISRTTVSRALTKAKDIGIIEIKINYPVGTGNDLEAQLEKKYGLKEVIIAYSNQEDRLADEIAKNASDFLVRQIKNPMKIALTRGSTMQQMTEALAQNPRIKFLETDQVVILPSEGSTNISLTFPKKKRMMYSNFIVEEVARILDANSYNFLCPLYVSKKTREALLEEPSIMDLINQLQQADLSMMGIGNLESDSTLIQSGYVSKETFQELKNQGGQAEFMSHVIDKYGQLVSQDYDSQIMSLSLDDLVKIPIRAGVAYGKQKHEAIRAVLAGKYINVLITDAQTARYLLGE
ncbi:sugar-binding transcriptional regulator [Absicoccus intestinalis]|uniref:Winged helix-turn-helix transcriptional regulator n=1 Tax=Absicoccus intestinalis TaxID=2926319 RepID=A0ABU4WKW0_9FIRM|nr:sugar-binding domain-containing protein [Absicoccus sp. CLA-KB-P134]MDX8417199.1 winged helix-turn-helix transcriptional regulator [Absicoccus sp. CLA-KB-P134]